VNITQQAGESKREADSLLNEHMELMETAKGTLNESQLVLTEARDQQNLTDTLLANVHDAHKLAVEAVENVEGMLREAERTLHTLQEFDEVVRRSREEADAAVALIPEIEEYIKSAENLTISARTLLEGAQVNAITAEEKAQSTQILAAETFQSAAGVGREVNATKYRTDQAVEMSTILESDLDDLEQRLRLLEEQGADDARLIQQALETADEAKDAAERSTQSVSSTLDTVNQILAQLQNLTSVDSAALDELEHQLDNAENQLIVSDIDRRYLSLETTHSDIERWIDSYGSELVALQLDVDNIRQINETLPRNCFNRVDLEVQPTELITPATTTISSPARW
jgi:coxsackievirus/adenovirus receptor